MNLQVFLVGAEDETVRAKIFRQYICVIHIVSVFTIDVQSFSVAIKMDLESDSIGFVLR